MQKRGGDFSSPTPKRQLLLSYAGQLFSVIAYPFAYSIRDDLRIIGRYATQATDVGVGRYGIRKIKVGHSAVTVKFKPDLFANERRA